MPRAIQGIAGCLLCIPKHNMIELLGIDPGALDRTLRRDRTQLLRGGKDPLVEERPLAPGKPISELTENDVTAFLVKEIPRLVARH